MDHILQQLYHCYCSPQDGMENWADYIHENFNGDIKGLGVHNLSIQLLLWWSVVNTVVMSLTPVILSLAIGIYYQKVH
jgi:hypothetical protein